MSMDSWEGNEKNHFLPQREAREKRRYLFVPFLEGQPLSPGVPGANHGFGKLQREFVEGKT